MMANGEVILSGPCRATAIPSGEETILREGTRVGVTQALGGAVTVRTDQGLFRIAPAEIEALGPDIVAEFEGGDPDPPPVRNREPFGEETVWNALRQCYDPEIPINIVDLGLVYGVHIEGGVVSVKLTLTTPGCPMSESMMWGVKQALLNLPSVSEANVDLVWDPPWNPSMMTDLGRAAIGMREY